MPADAPFPDPQTLPEAPADLRRGKAPKPSQATPIMEAIEGDGSPRSYLSASILAREAREFGAYWHGYTWGTERVLGAAPWSQESCDYRLDRSMDPCTFEPSVWKWSGPQPADWRPQVRVAADSVTVTFYTHTLLYQHTIIRHVDVYQPGRYVPDGHDDPIATGPPGIAF